MSSQMSEVARSISGLYVKHMIGQKQHVHMCLPYTSTATAYKLASHPVCISHSDFCLEGA